MIIATSWRRPLLCSTIAGLATGLGGFLVLWSDVSANSPHLAFSLGLSAGVMLTISIFDLFIPAVIFRSGTTNQIFMCCLASACGVFCEVLLSKCLPEDPGPNLVDVLPTKKGNFTSTRQRRFRLGLLLAITLALHNFPEGLAVAASNMQSESLGFLMTVAIAVHNIPEGLCVAMPIYAATQSWVEAVKFATLSGLTEPLGALVALLFMGNLRLMHNGWICCFALWLESWYPSHFENSFPRPLQMAMYGQCVKACLLGVLSWL